MRRYRYEENKERQEFKIGDVQGTPSKYSSRLKPLSLGMPRKASHLSSTIIGMSRFLFCSHDMRKFLERHVLFIFILIMHLAGMRVISIILSRILVAPPNV